MRTITIEQSDPSDTRYAIAKGREKAGDLLDIIDDLLEDHELEVVLVDDGRPGHYLFKIERRESDAV